MKSFSSPVVGRMNRKRTFAVFPAFSRHKFSSFVRRSSLTPLGRPESSPTLIKLPLFTSSTCLLPSGTGILSLYEERYLRAFRPLQLEHSLVSSKPVLFGHILREAPPGLVGPGLEAHLLPGVGVAACITAVHETVAGDGTKLLQVSYEGRRRFRVLQVEESGGTFEAVVEFYDDSLEEGAQEKHALDHLEYEVWESLIEVQRLLLELNGIPEEELGASLPAQLLRYRPPRPITEQPIDRIVQRLHDQNRPAGRDIEMWRRSSSSSSSPSAQAARSYGKSAPDPYLALAQDVDSVEGKRQELFSFAASQMVDVGVMERFGLMHSVSTRARLLWVKECIGPYLAQLQGQRMVKRALQDAT